MIYHVREGLIIPYVKKYKSYLTLIFALMFLLTQFSFLSSFSSAVVGPAENFVVDGKIWICHRNNAVKNRYNAINVSLSAVDGEGNNDHTSHTGPFATSEEHAQELKDDDTKWGDVIPPFNNFPGYNWDEAGQAYWRTSCNNGGQVLGDNICSVTAVSDTTNTVNEKAGADAQALSFIHSAWTASIPGATWIWGDNPVAEPANETIQTFKKTFYWNGPVTDAVLDIAADNDFIVFVNGIEVASDSSGTSFQNQKNYDVSANIVSDSMNTIEIEVTNWEWPTNNPQTNPAGLLYKLVVEGTDKNCGEPLQEIEPCEVGSTIFMIGDKEENQTDHPADEFTGSGNAGDFGTPHANPFVVGVNTDDEFPWNSNFSKSYGTDFDVNFNYSGSETIEAKLIVAWSPGKSATENKAVSLDGDVIANLSHQGTNVAGWYNNSRVYQDMITFELEPGDHTLRFQHTSGDGTFWDFVKLEVENCPKEVEENNASIQGRKYYDVNRNGNFDNAEKNEAGNPNRLDGWTISLFDTEWNLLQEMVTGDDNTDAGNVGKGQYRFVGLALGDYYVCEEDRDGWTQTQPASGPQLEDDETYCYEISINNPDQTVTGKRFGNYQSIGQIAGIVYFDDNENRTHDPEEELIEGNEVWLLTHNSPWTLQAIDTTEADGSFLFENLALPGTYYVCQDVQDGWFQTELNNAGLVGLEASSFTEGQVIGDSELDSVIGNFCYEVTLTVDNPSVLARNFGNFVEPDEETEEEPEEGQTLGVNTDGGQGQGSVLGASTGTLASTGTAANAPIITGILIILLASITSLVAVKQRN